MLRPAPHIRYHIAVILAAHWIEFVAQYKQWIRPVVFENVRKVLACRTPILGCHDCHEGVVIPGTYKKIHGEIVKTDPKTLDPDTEVMRFGPIFHYSSIPLFHVWMLYKKATLKDILFQ